MRWRKARFAIRKRTIHGVVLHDCFWPITAAGWTETRDQVMKHVKVLWGYDVTMTGIDRGSDKKVHEVSTAKM